MADTNVFKDQDVDLLDFPVDDNSRYGSDIMRAVSEFQVGTGDKVFRANKQGIWLGSASFNDAPFRVSMAGLLTLAQNIGTKNFTSTPTTPYNVGDLWTQGSGGAIKVCIVSRATGAYNASDWDLASNYQNSGQVTTIIGNTVTTGYVNALSITAGSISANNITAGNIVGSTLSTATSGQRVELQSTLAAYYNSSNVLVATTYADTSYFNINVGQSSSGTLFLNSGSSGGHVFAYGSSIYYSMNSGAFYPANNNYSDLGASSKLWRNFYVNSIYSVYIESNNIYSLGYIQASGNVGGANLSGKNTGDETTSTVGSKLNSLGGLNSTTLNVRRVTTGGVDSGWYGLTFNYGLLTSATVH